MLVDLPSFTLRFLQMLLANSGWLLPEKIFRSIDTDYADLGLITQIIPYFFFGRKPEHDTRDMEYDTGELSGLYRITCIVYPVIGFSNLDQQRDLSNQ